jgi:hypothetical protein
MGDYPEWTEEEIRTQAKIRGADGDALVKAYNEGKDYNESMLTEAERTDRLQLKGDLDKLSSLQAQIKGARAERAKRLADAELELAQITAANEAERKAVADQNAAEMAAVSKEQSSAETLAAFKAFQEAEAAKRNPEVKL